MPDMISVIEAIVASMLAGRRPLMSTASKAEWALLIFAALCAGAGIFFLAIALYQSLERLFIPPVAALISAAVVFAAAILAILLREFIKFKETSGHKPAHDELNQNIHTLMTSLYHELEEPIRENPKMSVAVAALAGLFAARRI
jgi:hypothetical protein